jgi:hypothetical protein
MNALAREPRTHARLDQARSGAPKILEAPSQRMSVAQQQCSADQSRREYGCTGWPNEGTKESIAEITTKIQSYKIDRGWRWRDPISGTWRDAFKRGFADNAIGEELNEFSVAVEFERPVRINYEIHPGIRWELVSKPPGQPRDRLCAHARAADRHLTASR